MIGALKHEGALEPNVMQLLATLLGPGMYAVPCAPGGIRSQHETVGDLGKSIQMLLIGPTKAVQENRVIMPFSRNRLLAIVEQDIEIPAQPPPATEYGTACQC